MELPSRRLLTIDEASKEAKVCRRTIYNWLQTGRIEFVRTPSGNARIYADTLFTPGTSWHEAQTRKASDEWVMSLQTANKLKNWRKW